MKSENREISKSNIVVPTWCWQAAAFFIPVIACLFFLAIKGVYPFGNQCILKSDMLDQYCPFLYEFSRLLKSGDFSLYNWNMGLGADFVSTYSYYLSSPLNFILILVPESYTIEFMTYSIVFRIGVCGFSFFSFLRYRFGITESQISTTEIPIIALFLSTAYALSGYVAAYNWQIMWMDCVALAPLIFLGLLKLQREKKPVLYFVTLAVAIFSNYYIALMICIFLVFYWIVLVFEEENNRERLKFSLSFFVYSLLAGGTSAVLILPTVSALSNSGSDMESFPSTIEWYYSPLVALARGNAFSKSYAGAEYWPNIYAGVFTLLLVFVFFFCQSISWKKKLPRILMLLFFQLSFMNNILSYMWHGFRFPTWFPSRQSFLYIFLILTMAMEGYLKIATVKKRSLFVSLGGLVFFVFLSAFARDKEITGWFSFRITCLLIVIYAILYFLSNVVEPGTKQLFRRLIIVIAFGEVLLSMYTGSFDTVSREDYVSRVGNLQQLLALRDEEGFYRTDMPGANIRNDGSLIGYSSLSVFNTILNTKVADYYNEHVMSSSSKYYYSAGITPIEAAMLGTRYYISTGKERESSLRALVGNVDKYYLYENSYYLPIGFTIPANVSEETIDEGAYLNRLNDMAVLLTGKEAYSQSFEYTHNNIDNYTELIIEEEGFYYLQNTTSFIQEILVISPDGQRRKFQSLFDKRLIELGYAQKGDKFILMNPEEMGMVFNLFKADLDVISQTVDILGKHPFIMDKKDKKQDEDPLSSIESGVIRGNNQLVMEGRIQVDEGEKVFFSIPADKGWRAYVDGEEIEVERYCDAFLCLSPKAGEHMIRLVFEVPYLKLGAGISILCLVLAFSAFGMTGFYSKYYMK